LGFEKTLLEKQIGLDNPGAKAGVLECIYEDDEKFRLFQKLGREASIRFNDHWLRNGPVPEFPTNNSAPTDEYKKTTFYFLNSLSEATAQFFTEAARLKDRGFREECEWRIVFQARRDALISGFLKFRKGQFGQTPYIEIPLSLAKSETSPLRRIVVGPSSHKEEVKHWVELLLETHGIRIRRDDRADTTDGVTVATSLIPYRSA